MRSREKVSSYSDTIWPLDEHTIAKHEILANYLAGWFPILSRYQGRIVYIDGFAGPGIYSGGELGSPIIALKTASDHMLRSSFKQIMFLFIESRQDRAEKLKTVIQGHCLPLPDKFAYQIYTGEFETVVGEGLETLEKEDKKLAPTFAFIDPFGYTGFSMEFLSKILSYQKCELFITFMSGFIKRFLDEEKEESLTKLFGTDEWKKIKGIQGYRDETLLELYKKQLKEKCGVEYVRSFEMVNRSNQPIYHLIFCTNSIKGLEVMKNSMWAVDKRGQYRFSDRLGSGQTYLFSDTDYWKKDVANLIYKNYRGKTVSIEEIKNYTIVETDYIYRSGIMQYMEQNNPERIVKVDNRKRKNTFPDGCIITFS
jgi:three-Cys-motif partner protein